MHKQNRLCVLGPLWLVTDRKQLYGFCVFCVSQFVSFCSTMHRGPVPVLVMSLLFIACVFLLHIWGKYTRS